MAHQENPQSGKKIRKRKTILGALFTREEPDQDYIPELKSQWNKMDKTERVKFVLGAVLGVILFFGALVGAFLLLSALFQ